MMSLFNWLLGCLLAILFVAFVAVMVCESAKELVYGLLGLYEKSETLKFLGIGMGGVLVALQALMSYKRAKALEDTAKAQAKATEEQAKANQNTEQGQRQERLKNAIEHLGNESDSVRLGGAYELFHLAQDTEELRQTVLDILCAHIRQRTGESEYQKKHKSKPSEEVQSLLTLLFVQDHDVFKGLHINLQGSWLRRANLRKARLEGAVLREAQLQGADLSEAQLQGAVLREAQLQGALLFEAQLQGAALSEAQLQGAVLIAAQLQGAALSEAQLQGADLSEAQLQGAVLYKAQLQGVGQSFDSSFERRIMKSSNKESDLSGVTFEGGLTLEDLDVLVKDLSPEKATELRKKLEKHVDKPASDKPPEGSITGAYTKEDAEKWIAEYKEAMSEVPGEADSGAGPRLQRSFL